MIRFGIGKSRWEYRVKQIFVTPCVGIILVKDYEDDDYVIKKITLNVSWLLWGAYMEISVKTKENEDD